MSRMKHFLNNNYAFFLCSHDNQIYFVWELSNIFFTGIYAGNAKPSDLDAYLGPFVNEMKQLEEGLTITSNTGTEKTVKVTIRAFICDSPARAMIKGNLID